MTRYILRLPGHPGDGREIAATWVRGELERLGAWAGVGPHAEVSERPVVVEAARDDAGDLILAAVIVTRRGVPYRWVASDDGGPVVLVGDTPLARGAWDGMSPPVVDGRDVTLARVRACIERFRDAHAQREREASAVRDHATALAQMERARGAEEILACLDEELAR